MNNSMYVAVPFDEVRKYVLALEIPKEICLEYYKDKIQNCEEYLNKIFNPTDEELIKEQEYYNRVLESNNINLKQENWNEILSGMKMFEELKAFYFEKIKKVITENGEF